MFEFRLKCHSILFLYVRLAIFQHWFRWNGLAPSEPMTVSLPTHICVPRPQLVKLGGISQWLNISSILFRNHIFKFIATCVMAYIIIYALFRYSSQKRGSYWESYTQSERLRKKISSLSLSSLLLLLLLFIIINIITNYCYYHHYRHYHYH